MKIGAFCRRFGVTEHTVRLYIRRGLLIPEVCNRQYRFSEACAADIRRILALKEDGFTLEEIYKVLSLFRISGFATEEDLARLQGLYAEKQTVLEGELAKAQGVTDAIEQLIAELETEGAHVH